MTNSPSSKTHGPDQPETSGPSPKSIRTKMGKSDDSDKKSVIKKLKDAEISVPIVYGNVAFWLGKKASEYQSHKWTVYVRGATNEDLGVVIKRVVFQLHSSFNNPTRVVDSPPFELSESGWGEFEIAITLYFHNDACDKPLNLYHHLKLYPEDESGQMSTKKPVVVESYDEVVFAEPSEGFFARVQNHPAVIVPRLPAGFTLPPPVPVEDSSRRKRGETKDHSLSQWFMNFSEADELLQLAAARQQVQAHIAKLRRQISVIDGPQQQQQQQLKSTSDQYAFCLLQLGLNVAPKLRRIILEFEQRDAVTFMIKDFMNSHQSVLLMGFTAHLKNLKGPYQFTWKHFKVNLIIELHSDFKIWIVILLSELLMKKPILIEDTISVSWLLVVEQNKKRRHCTAQLVANALNESSILSFSLVFFSLRTCMKKYIL